MEMQYCGHRNSPLLAKWTYYDLIGQVSYYVGGVVTHSECTEIKGCSIESNKFVSSLLALLVHILRPFKPLGMSIKGPLILLMVTDDTY